MSLSNINPCCSVSFTAKELSNLSQVIIFLKSDMHKKGID